jgi:hypothetical protein
MRWTIASSSRSWLRIVWTKSRQARRADRRGVALYLAPDGVDACRLRRQEGHDYLPHERAAPYQIS